MRSIIRKDPQDIDVLVFVHDLRGWFTNYRDTKQVSQDGNTEFGNSGRRPADQVSTDEESHVDNGTNF